MSKNVKTEPDSATDPGQAGASNGGGASSMEVDGDGGVFVKKEEDPGMVFTSTTEFTSRLQVIYGVVFIFFRVECIFRVRLLLFASIVLCHGGACAVLSSNAVYSLPYEL